MKRANPRQPCRLLHKFHRPAPPAAPAILLPQIELVDERIPPQPLQTVPKAQHDVPHSPAAIHNQPRAAEIRIAQQRHQRHVRFLLLEAVAVEHVILPHESQQRARIRLDRQTKLRLRVHYVPEARVGTAALGCPVERSSTAVHTTFSSASAIPMPPLTHRVATPRLVLRFSISCSSVTVMRVPVHPMGCPIAIAPPFTLSRSRFKFNVRSQASTCAANASFNSISPNSCSLRLSFSSSFRSAGTGPIPIVRGSTPAEVTAAIRASGFRLFCFTKCSLATTTAAAPSVIPEEFPAVIVPGVSLDFENTGGSFPSFSQTSVRERMLIARKLRRSFFPLDGPRNNPRVKAPRRNRPRRARLRQQRILILLLPRNLVLLRQHLARLAHHHLRQRTEKSVAIHPVHQFLVAQPISPSRLVQIIRNPRHRLRPARQNAVRIAQQNRLVRQRDRLHP